ncbi:hypothetical protein KIPE111705_29055 [Kibdelosporangium persicum]
MPQDNERPVFASAGRGRAFVRLASRLLAAGMVVLVVVIVATTLCSVHVDTALPWLGTVPR